MSHFMYTCALFTLVFLCLSSLYMSQVLEVRQVILVGMFNAILYFQLLWLVGIAVVDSTWQDNRDTLGSIYICQYVLIYYLGVVALPIFLIMFVLCMRNQCALPLSYDNIIEYSQNKITTTTHCKIVITKLIWILNLLRVR